MEESLYVREKIAVFRREHIWCPEDGTIEQAKLADLFIFQDRLLQMGFQSET